MSKITKAVIPAAGKRKPNANPDKLFAKSNRISKIKSPKRKMLKA